MFAALFAEAAATGKLEALTVFSDLR